MRSFFVDVLHDLRQTKMLPIAVLLVLALVLVPVFVLDSAGDERSEQTTLPPVGPQPGSGLPPLRLEQAGERRLSRLDAFSSKDPFGPPGGRTPGQDAQAAGAGAAELAQSALGGGSGADPSSASAFPPLEVGPTGGGGSSGGGSSGGGGPEGPAGSSGSAPPSGSSDGASGESEDEDPQELYTFRVDLRFGAGDKVSDQRGVKRLTPLPSEELPLLVFLGTNETGTEAVFLLDGQQLMPAGGRGECRPTPARCTFLSVRKGSAVALVDQEGTRYELKVVDIKLARVRPADSSDGADEIEPPPAGSEGSPGSEGSDGSPDSGQSDDSSSPYDSENLRHRDEGSPLSFPDLFDLILDRR